MHRSRLIYLLLLKLISFTKNTFVLDVLPLILLFSKNTFSGSNNVSLEINFRTAFSGFSSEAYYLLQMLMNQILSQLYKMKSFLLR